MIRQWVLLIYTVPATPSRKRATIWREVRKLGAIYLRDGVVALPERDDTRAALQAIAGRVVEFEGHATIVSQAMLDPEGSAFVVAEARSARGAEYEEIAREATGFL